MNVKYIGPFRNETELINFRLSLRKRRESYPKAMTSYEYETRSEGGVYLVYWKYDVYLDDWSLFSAKNNTFVLNQAVTWQDYLEDLDEILGTVSAADTGASEIDCVHEWHPITLLTSMVEECKHCKKVKEEI